jgi:hypothetical protein
MSNSTLVMGASYDPHHASAESAFAHFGNAESAYAENTTQEIIIEQSSMAREVMLASEQSLMSVWMNPEEEEAWKNL